MNEALMKILRYTQMLKDKRAGSLAEPAYVFGCGLRI